MRENHLRSSLKRITSRADSVSPESGELHLNVDAMRCMSDVLRLDERRLTVSVSN
jgi:hypothetical protein